ncbi:hypothetical protein [Propionivibrio sp.]|uniref:hypothetical protein n=1 Tax=Propionivibrio sp. TaxID=2212460 RepID=UPI003BF0AA1D
MTGYLRLLALRKWIVRLVGAAFVLYVAYFAYSMATGEERMTDVCNQIKPGMTTDQLLKLAEENGLGPRKLNVGTKLAYLAEVRSFGRHACRVELDAGIVKSATYNYAD